ncbi:MAG: hypothetical protein Q9162_007309 [Coniocarpon cinnabarinum]
MISTIGDEHVEREERVGSADSIGLFTVRSGGHSPLSCAANLQHSLEIDLSPFNEEKPSGDGSCTKIGTGARWGDVSMALDARGLAVVGAMASHVGIGGVTLGDSNVINYEIVLANITVITASETVHSNLWEALKGGSNNFGIVTHFTVRSSPSTNVWSNFLYIGPGQYQKVLSAFHQAVRNVDPNTPDNSTPDEGAAGPLACFTILQQSLFHVQVISNNLVHTRPPPQRSSLTSSWPGVWVDSSFKSIWRFRSTLSMGSMTSATDGTNALSSLVKRQLLATTTFKNDPRTIDAAHKAYSAGLQSLCSARVKDLSFTLVLQPLVPAWACKGDPNPCGFDAPS